MSCWWSVTLKLTNARSNAGPWKLLNRFTTAWSWALSCPLYDRPSACLTDWSICWAFRWSVASRVPNALTFGSLALLTAIWPSVISSWLPSAAWSRNAESADMLPGDAGTVRSLSSSRAGRAMFNRWVGRGRRGPLVSGAERRERNTTGLLTTARRGRGAARREDLVDGGALPPSPRRGADGPPGSTTEAVVTRRGGRRGLGCAARSAGGGADRQDCRPGAA